MDEKKIAQSDVGTMLYAKGADNKYSELIEIISAPAESTAGGTIEVTVLKSPTKQYIPDRVDVQNKTLDITIQRLIEKKQILYVMVQYTNS